ncbi:ArsR/SmtB family transcription factor [Kribbella deserti]|uniref:DUF5937 family protein n=1 Tax=Kribbella deserti TaxID=1926257 RepID=A0ABV6QV91_9ACTN
MLELAFTVEDLARTRFAISPLWEIVASVRLLKSPRARAFHQGWAVETEQRLHRSGNDLGLLFGLVDPAVWYLPDLLSPSPRSPVPDLTSELAALRRLPADQVRADLGVLAYARTNQIGSLAEAKVPRGPDRRTPERLPAGPIRDLYDDPETGLDRLANELAAYWDLAIGPHWGRIRALLEGDVLYRARQLADEGHARLFSDLADTVRWRNGSLFIRHRRFGGVRELSGEGLLLVPSAFVWPAVFSSAIPPWQPTLTYPARGIATIWEASGGAVPEGLAKALGRSRADLLGQLDLPRSTTELASRTGLTPGGASQHLSALRAAGLVTPHRVGRIVLYARTAAAEALLVAAGQRSDT